MENAEEEVEVEVAEIAGIAAERKKKMFLFCQLAVDSKAELESIEM